jgi:hypothetical protein
MSKRKAYSKAFHEALSYLVNTGYKHRYIAKLLTEVGEKVSHTTVYYWDKEKRLPHSRAHITFVIGWAEYIRRMDCFITDLHAKIDEAAFEVTLQGSIDYLRRKGNTYEVIGELADNAEPQTIRRWEQGHQPKQDKKPYGVKLPQGVPDRRICGITGKYAVETGLRERLYYALYPVFERNQDLVDDKSPLQDWKEWCTEYEARKARGEV